mmetsp:Transcript_24721/g.38496  ORF Transcript_24721/g.38496 Transcript_24721/m.38496 type:complete len:86 (+) Transcript_24721:134-391(+)
MEEFFKCERNYVILSNSGKPIFSAHGDIYTLSSVYATLYAMVSKVQTFEFQTESVSEMAAGEAKKTVEEEKKEEDVDNQRMAELL